MGSRKRNNFDRFVEQRIKDGVEFYRTSDLDVVNDPGADFLLENALDYYNLGRDTGNAYESGMLLPRLKPKPTPANDKYELKLSSESSFSEAVRWLGGAVSKFGDGLLSVDTRISVLSNRATDVACDRVRNILNDGRAAFTFLAKDSSWSSDSSRYERLTRLQNLIGSYDLPGIDITVINPDQDILDAAQTGEGIQELLLREGIIIPPSDQQKP